MKTNKVWFTLAGTALVIALAGCGQKENASLEDHAKTAATETGNAVQHTVEAAKTAGNKLVQDMKEAGQKAAQDITDKAKEVAAPVNAKAQGIINEAKQYVQDGKLTEAYNKWKELAGEKLSAEQQIIADGLKTQIDKLLGATNKAATNATAAGNLLKK